MKNKGAFKVQESCVIPFKEGHIEQAIDILIQTFSKAPWFENWSYAYAKARIDDMYFSSSFRGVACFKEGSMIGFAIGNLEYWEQSIIYYLNELCVLPSHKGSYIGSELMQKLEKDLKAGSVHQMYLSTVEEKGGPASFFHKQGYNTNETRIIMEKNL